jgi:alkaline phosphatase D
VEKLTMLLQKYSALLLFLCLLSCDRQQEAAHLPETEISKFYRPEMQPFYHGVASGDPLPNQVIIWTRFTPYQKGESFPVKWLVAKDEAMTEIVKEGVANAQAAQDYTVKVDVTGLEPAQYYYYQFREKGKTSVVGRTKTAPERETSKVALAVMSCTNYEAGYYNALANLARRDSIDAVIHLGDYIYEYEPGGYGDEKLDRRHLPAKELISLEDYRTRYAQYRLDRDFQEVHRRHPFITIWDDHEIANNAHTYGAENHQEEEGDYIQRRQAAQQSYYEWLPIRENEGGHLYRKITMGKMADILLLDERVAGRSAPAENQNDKNYTSKERSMLGEQQYQWLTKSLSSSEARWKIIGNQVIFSEFDYSAVKPNKPKNMDAWDGYPEEKKRLIQFVQEYQINNLLFVTGDTHCSWAFEVPSTASAYLADPATAIAIELATPSITSSNYDEHESRDRVLEIENIYQKENPHLKFVNLRDHGYLLLEITEQAVHASYQYVDTVGKPSDKEQSGGWMKIESGVRKIQIVN